MLPMSARIWVLFVVWLLTGLPVWAQALPADTERRYQAALTRAEQAIGRGDYNQALASLDLAEGLYPTLLKSLLESCKCTPEQARALSMQLQIRLVPIILTLGERLYDLDRFDDVLGLYQRGQLINADFPCLRAETGFLYVTLDRRTLAVTELYEAKRLARFPARRDIVAAQNQVACPRERIDRRSHGLLEQLGLDTEYPLGLDLESGQAMPGRIVPGMGAEIPWRGQMHPVYFEESLASVKRKLGEPEQSTRAQVGGEESLHLRYGETLLVFDAHSQHLQSLELKTAGQPVLLPGGYLRIGEPISQLDKNLGQGYGFEPLPLGSNRAFDIRRYTQLGVDFYGSDGLVTAVTLQVPE